VRIRLEERRSGPALRRFGRAGGCSFSWSVFSWVEFSRRPFIAMCGVARLGSASRDQATGLVVGGTHHNSSKGDTADPVVWSLFCSGLGDCCPIFALFARGRADRSALTIHLLRSCWDPPYTSGFPVVGVLVGLYASLQCCHQSINPPSDARRRAPKNNSPTTLCYAFQLYLLERSRICDVPDPCAPGPQQGVGRPK